MIYSEMTETELAAYSEALAEEFGYTDDEYVDVDMFGEDR